MFVCSDMSLLIICISKKMSRRVCRRSASRCTNRVKGVPGIPGEPRVPGIDGNPGINVFGGYLTQYNSGNVSADTDGQFKLLRFTHYLTRPCS